MPFTLTSIGIKLKTETTEISPSVIASTQMLRSPPKYLNNSFNQNYF